MAHMKQTPRNPNMDKPTTAMGIDVQPEKRTPMKQTSKKLPIKGGKQPPKTPVTQINKARQITYRRN